MKNYFRLLTQKEKYEISGGSKLVISTPIDNTLPVKGVIISKRGPVYELPVVRPVIK